MDKIVADLKKLVPFKDTLEAGDIVLIAAKKPQLLVYGLVASIERDPAKRDEWWLVSMHILSLPPRLVTWILRTSQMTGQEVFTMDGEARFMKAVDFGQNLPGQGPGKQRKSPAGSGLRRVK